MKEIKMCAQCRKVCNPVKELYYENGLYGYYCQECTGKD